MPPTTSTSHHLSQTSPRKNRACSVPTIGSHTPQQKMREKIRDELKYELFNCTHEDWLKAYAPSALQRFSPELVEGVMNKLREENILDDEGWVPLRVGRERKYKENELFSCLGPIATQITETAKELDNTLEQTFSAKPSTTEMTYGEVFKYKSFPDFRSVLLHSSATPDAPKNRRRSARLAKLGNKSKSPDDFQDSSRDTSDTGMVAEFKLESKPFDKGDNELKILGAATDILYNDPCRERVFAFTIEDTHLRFWHFSRSHIAVCESFDLHEEKEIFVRFLLFLIFAGKQELGFDPSAERIKGQKIFYRFQAGGRTWQTIGPPISEEASYRIVGRATRVWKVQEYNGTDTFGPECVLKDVWLYEGADLERDIQTSILENLEDENDRQTLRRHFLNIVCDDEFLLDAKNKEKRVVTPSCPNLTRIAWTGSSFSLRNKSVKGSQRGGTRDAAKSQVQAPPQVSDNIVRPRKHVRTVVKEVCESVYDLSDFKDFLNCMIGIVTALKLFCKAGFTLRDCSAGNSLLHGLIGILSDIEYAKKYSAASSLEPKTGTPDFMAAEYQLREYFHLSSEMKKLRGLQPAFIPHFIHDLESVYWQYLWFLFYRIPSQIVENADVPALEKNYELIYSLQKKFFIDVTVDGNGSRVGLIYGGAGSKNIMEPLESLYESFSGLEGLLAPISLEEELREEYKRVTAALVQDDQGVWRIPHEIFTDEIYNKFIKAFEEALGALGKGSCPVMNMGDFKPGEGDVGGDVQEEQGGDDCLPIITDTMSSSRKRSRELEESDCKSRKLPATAESRRKEKSRAVEDQE